MNSSEDALKNAMVLAAQEVVAPFLEELRQLRLEHNAVAQEVHGIKGDNGMKKSIGKLWEAVNGLNKFMWMILGASVVISTILGIVSRVIIK